MLLKALNPILEEFHKPVKALEIIIINALIRYNIGIFLKKCVYIFLIHF